MKKFLVLSVLLVSGSFAVAYDAAPAAPPPPTGETSAPAPGHVRGKRHEAREAHRAEAEAMRAQVQQACSAEIAATGCSEPLGKGLMKCIQNYKKSNAGFQMSDGCKAAVREGREMRQERKEARRARKGGAPAQDAPATTETK